MTVEKFQYSLAVVIGIDDYRNGVPSLKTPVNDAQTLATILKDRHGYDVKLLLNEAANGNSLKDLLETELPQQLNKDDRLLFYFAGHGIALNGDDGPEGYLIPSGASLGEISTYLSMATVNQALLKLPCRHFLGILDCCFAGAFRWSSTRKLVPIELGTIHKERFDRFIRDPAWQVITSAASDQFAQDAFDLKSTQRGLQGNHSPFAAALIEALEGKADAYPPAEAGKEAGDGVITATELYLYLRDRVEPDAEIRAMRQTPGIFPLTRHDKGEFIFLSPGHPLNLPPAPPLDESSNPYRGLESFEEAHKDLFFGRQALTHTLAEFVTNHALTVVLGASGSGKSSLVKAGLIPKLQQGNDWICLSPFRPGESPFKALNQVLQVASLPEIAPAAEATSSGLLTPAQSLSLWFQEHPHTHLLVVVDQFEELITLCQDQQERQQFLVVLAEAIATHPTQLHLVLTLRSDFEPQFRNTALETDWQGARFVVPAMTRDELRQAIEAPASARVMVFDPHELVDQLIDEVANMPGALPLLSFALSELYLNYLKRQKDARDKGETLDRAMTQADYAAMGGVTQSLTQRADQEYEALVQRDPEYAKTIQNVMLRMVAVGGGELARRRVPLSEFEYLPAQNERVKAVIQRFADARLLVEGQDSDGKPYAEPAHDALVRGWQKLLTWKLEQEERLILQRRLTPAAEEWKDVSNQAQSKSFLAKAEPVIDGLDRGFYAIERLLSKTGARFVRLWQRSQPQQERSREQPGQFLWNTNPYLDVLNQQLQSDNHWFNQVEAKFVEESVLQRRQNTSWRWRIATAVILGLSGLTIAALIGQRNAQIGQTTASRASAEASFRTNEQLDALVVSLRAGKNIRQILLPDNVLQNQVEQTLRNMLYGAKESNRWDAPPGRVWGMFFTSDRQLLIITNENNTVRLWNKDGKQVVELKGQEGLYRGSISVSPDGSKIATASKDGTVRLWDLQGKKLSEFKAHDGMISSYIMFSPNGRTIATAGTDGNDAYTASHVRLWDMEGKKVKGWKYQTGTSIIGLGFNSNSEPLVATLVAGHIKVSNWSGDRPQNVATTDEVGYEPGQPLDIKFSPSGKQAVIYGAPGAGESENASLWNFSESGKAQSLNGRIREGGSFSPDGNRIAATGVDGTVNLLGTSGGVQSGFKLPQGKVQMSTFSPDGSQLVTLGDDNTIRFWNLDQQPLSKFKLAQNGIESISFSPDRRTIATTDSAGTIRLLDLQGNSPKEFAGLPKSTSASFSPDGQTIATTGDGGMVRLLDLQGKVIKKFQAHPGKVTSVSWSQDGRNIATIGDGGANNPDNKSQTLDNTLVRLWDTQGKQLEEKKQNIFTNTFQGISFQSNGKPLLLSFVSDGDAGAAFGNVNLLDFSERPSTNLIPGRQAGNTFNSVKISQDGSLLLTTSGNTIHFWNLKGEKLIEFSGNVDSNNPIKSLSLSLDNSMLAVVAKDGTAELWQLGEFDELLSQGCDRVRDYLEHNPHVNESDRHLCDR